MEKKKTQSDVFFIFYFYFILTNPIVPPSRSITRAYYRNSVGGLLLFDITNHRSFQNVYDWLEEARSHVQPHSIVFLLVGHKCDLEAQRQVTQQEAEKLAGAYGMKYVETSARDAINVEKVWMFCFFFLRTKHNKVQCNNKKNPIRVVDRGRHGQLVISF